MNSVQSAGARVERACNEPRGRRQRGAARRGCEGLGSLTEYAVCNPIDPWAEAEFASLDLGDARRVQRVKKMVSQLARKPGANLSEAWTDRAPKKGAYRLVENKRVEAQAIREAHSETTWARMAAFDRVLVVQDTTGVGYSTHEAARGLGPLDHGAGKGYLVHTGLGMTEGGQPLGVAHQEVWVRPPEETGKSEQRRRRPWPEKESYKWQRTVETVEVRKRAGQEVIVVGDRESDVYGLFSSERARGVQLLVRSGQNRRVKDEDGKRLWDAVRAAPLAGKVVVEVTRAGGRKGRQAVCEVRFREVTLRPPSNVDLGVRRHPVTVWIVAVEEPHPPKGEQGLSWLLIATWPVTGFESAAQCARWYALRWRVERYHFVLKSGCRIEDAQERDRESLERLHAICSVAAWRVMALTYEARTNPEGSCEPLLTRQEWQVLYAHHHRRAPRKGQKPPTIQQAALWVAELGGFWGRKGDGPPGPKVIWRGLRVLANFIEGLSLAPALRQGD